MRVSILKMSVMFSIEMSCLCHFSRKSQTPVICRRRRTGRSRYQRPKRRGRGSPLRDRFAWSVSADGGVVAQRVCRNHG